MKGFPDEHDALIPYMGARFKKGDIRYRPPAQEPGKASPGLEFQHGDTFNYRTRQYEPAWYPVTDALPKWQQWYEARQHPTRRGVNILDPSFTPEMMEAKVGEHQKALEEAQAKQRWLERYGDADPIHRFGPEAGKHKGWQVVRLDPHQAEGDSEALGHCIGRDDQPYKHNIGQGNIQAFSLRDAEGYPRVSWHINPSEDSIGHMQGKSGEPKDDYRELISMFNHAKGLPDEEGHEEPLEGEDDEDEYDEYVHLPDPDDVDTYVAQWNGEYDYPDDANIGEDTEIVHGTPDWDAIARDYLRGYGDHSTFFNALRNDPSGQYDFAQALEQRLDLEDQEERQLVSLYNSEGAGHGSWVDMPPMPANEVDKYNQIIDDGEEPEPTDYDELAQDYLKYPDHYGEIPTELPHKYWRNPYQDFHENVDNYGHADNMHEALQQNIDWSNPDHQLASQWWNDAMPQHQVFQQAEPAPLPIPGQTNWSWPNEMLNYQTDTPRQWNRPVDSYGLAPEGWGWGATSSSHLGAELHVGLAIPEHVAQEIHDWAKKQDWPEGTELEDPSEYHITLMYSPDGHEEHHDADWLDNTKGYDVEVTGVDEFGEGDGEAATVLRIKSPEVKEHANSLQDEAEDQGLEINRFPGGYKPHITVAYGPGKPKSCTPPKLKFKTGPSSVSTPRDSAWHLADYQGWTMESPASDYEVVWRPKRAWTATSPSHEMSSISSRAGVAGRSAPGVSNVKRSDYASAERVNAEGSWSTIPTERLPVRSATKNVIPSSTLITSMGADAKRGYAREAPTNNSFEGSSETASLKAIASCAETATGWSGLPGKTADYQGYTNWETWNVKLIMDNEQPTYNASREIVRSGAGPQQFEQWALQAIIGPYNKERIQEAQEWNAIHPDERRRMMDERDRSEYGDAAVDLGRSLMDAGGFLNDPGEDDDAEIIDPNEVNWYEIYESIYQELVENNEYAQQQGEPAQQLPQLQPNPADQPGDTSFPQEWTSSWHFSVETPWGQDHDDWAAQRPAYDASGHQVGYDPAAHQEGKGFMLQDGSVWTWPTAQRRPMHLEYSYRVKRNGQAVAPGSAFHINQGGKYFQYGEGRALTPGQHQQIVEADPRLTYAPAEAVTMQGGGHGTAVLDKLREQGLDRESAWHWEETPETLEPPRWPRLPVQNLRDKRSSSRARTDNVRAAWHDLAHATELDSSGQECPSTDGWSALHNPSRHSPDSRDSSHRHERSKVARDRRPRQTPGPGSRAGSAPDEALPHLDPSSPEYTEAPHILAPATELREWLADLGEAEPISPHHNSEDDFIQAPRPSTAPDLPYFPPANVPKEYKQSSYPRHMFHNSPSVPDDILDQGLLQHPPEGNPGYGYNVWGQRRSMPGVYMAPEEAMEEWDDPLGMTYRIDTSHLDPSLMEPDEMAPGAWRYRGDVPPHALEDWGPLYHEGSTRTADSPITQADATNDPLGKNPAIIPSRQGDPDYLEDSPCPHCLQSHRPDEPCGDSSVGQYKQMQREWANRDPNSQHSPHGPGAGPDGLHDQQMDLGSHWSAANPHPDDPEGGWEDDGGKLSSWDPLVCQHCNSPMTEPRQLGAQWVNSCPNCKMTRQIPLGHPLLKQVQQQEALSPYPELLGEVGPRRPWNVFASQDS